MSRQRPPSHRGDAHHVDFLKQAVIEYSYSLEPLQRVSFQNCSFQHLYSELEAALLLRKENELKVVRSSVTHKSIDKEDDISAEVDYIDQSRHGQGLEPWE